MNVADPDPIAARIESLGDWRGELLEKLRKIVKDADPDIVEELKWRKPSNPLGVPTWSRAGMVCTGETYKDKVKMTFARGAFLHDPAGLFNAADLGGTRRAIDFQKDTAIDVAALKALIRRAVAINLAREGR